MNILELHDRLKAIYQDGNDCGVVRGSEGKYPNISFVIPPSPIKDAPQGLSYQLMSEASSMLNRFALFEEMDDLDKLINYLFVRREALQSSRMEGTWSTIDAVFTPSHVEHTENKQATLSIRAYAHALEGIFEKAHKNKESVLSLETICHLHKRIMEKDPTFMGRAGHVREPGAPGSIVFIGGLGRPENSTYNPVPPEFVKSSLKKVVDWFTDDEMAVKGDAGVGLNLIMRIAIGHAHFGAVHPFSDGNGRVGRALWPLQMIAAGHMPIYLSGYVEKEKVEYNKALECAQKKLDYIRIIDFISKAVISSSMEMKITKEKLLGLPQVWANRGGFRENSTAKNALKMILKMPVFTAGDIKEQVGCSRPAATKAVNDLIEKKIVRERTGYKRNRIFVAEEVICLLARDHGEDPELALDKAMRVLKS